MRGAGRPPLLQAGNSHQRVPQSVAPTRKGHLPAPLALVVPIFYSAQELHRLSVLGTTLSLSTCLNDFKSNI